MADHVAIPEELQQRFSEFTTIASLTRTLRQNIDEVNKDNMDAAGKDDATARAYHSQVDAPTSDLSTLVEDIATLFGITGDRGTAAAGVLQQGDEAAADEVNGWSPK